MVVVLVQPGAHPIAVDEEVVGDVAVGLAPDGQLARARESAVLVQDGVVKSLNIEGPGKFEVSDAETMLKQL